MTTRHRHNVAALAASPSQETFATASVDGELKLWSLNSREPIHALPPAEGTSRDRIHAAAFSPKGTLAVVTGWSGTAELWSSTHQEAVIPSHTGRATALAWSHDGALLATGGADRRPGSGGDDDEDDAIPPMDPPTVRLWRGDARIAELEGATGTLYAIAFSADGQLIAAGGSGPDVVIWRSTGEVLARIPAPGEVGHLRFDAGGLMIVGGDGAAWAKEHTYSPIALPGIEAPSRAAWSGAGRVVAGTFDAITVHDVSDLAKPRLLASVPGRAYAMTQVADEVWVATADALLRLTLDGAPIGAPTPLKETP